MPDLVNTPLLRALRRESTAIEQAVASLCRRQHSIEKLIECYRGAPEKTRELGSISASTLVLPSTLENILRMLDNAQAPLDPAEVRLAFQRDFGRVPHDLNRVLSRELKADGRLEFNHEQKLIRRVVAAA